MTAFIILTAFKSSITSLCCHVIPVWLKRRGDVWQSMQTSLLQSYFNHIRDWAWLTLHWQIGGVFDEPRLLFVVDHGKSKERKPKMMILHFLPCLVFLQQRRCLHSVFLTKSRWCVSLRSHRHVQGILFHIRILIQQIYKGSRFCIENPLCIWSRSLQTVIIVESCIRLDDVSFNCEHICGLPPICMFNFLT